MSITPTVLPRERVDLAQDRDRPVDYAGITKRIMAIALIVFTVLTFVFHLPVMSVLLLEVAVIGVYSMASLSVFHRIHYFERRPWYHYFNPFYYFYRPSPILVNPTPIIRHIDDRRVPVGTGERTFASRPWYHRYNPFSYLSTPSSSVHHAPTRFYHREVDRRVPVATGERTFVRQDPVFRRRDPFAESYPREDVPVTRHAVRSDDSAPRDRSFEDRRVRPSAPPRPDRTSPQRFEVRHSFDSRPSHIGGSIQTGHGDRYPVGRRDNTPTVDGRVPVGRGRR
jgi:hypothetical protein